MPSICSASASALSGERFVTTMCLAPDANRCRAASVDILPAPTTSTLLPVRLPNTCCASCTATDDTFAAPRAIAVSLRTRFATPNARSRQRPSSGPLVPATPATPYAALSWPRICASPSTSESSALATRNTCRTALLAGAIAVDRVADVIEPGVAGCRQERAHRPGRVVTGPGDAVDLDAVARRHEQRLGDRQLLRHRAQRGGELLVAKRELLAHRDRRGPPRDADDEHLAHVILRSR